MTFLQGFLDALALDAESGFRCVDIKSTRDEARARVTLEFFFQRKARADVDNRSFELTIREEDLQARSERMLRHVAFHAKAVLQ